MTIKKIAEKANVSAGTVDRVINNRGYVNSQKRALIEKIIKDTGYKPNLHARNLKLNQVITIGFLTPLIASEDGYWDMVHQGVLKAKEDLVDVSFIVETFEYDRRIPSSFTTAAEEMVKSGVKGCVIIPKCVSEAIAFVNAHPELKIVLVDSALPDVNSVICMIGQNAYLGGLLAGRILSLLQPNAKTLLTFSFMNSTISKERIRGFKQYFSLNNSCEILDLAIDSTQSIPAAIQQAYRDHPYIDGIFSPCSAGYLVGTEVVNLGHKEKTKIVTYDLIPKNKVALRNGYVDCILSQRPIFQGYSGVFQLYRYLVKQQAIDQEMKIQVDIIFQENIPDDFDDKAISKLNSYCVPYR